MKKILIILIIIVLGVVTWKMYRPTTSQGTTSAVSTTTSTSTTTGDEVRLTGVIQAIDNQQPVDGNLMVQINGTWVIIGGGGMVTSDQGQVIGFDLNNIDSNVGKTAEVFARKSGYGQSLTILTNNKYYIKVTK